MQFAWGREEIKFLLRCCPRFMLSSGLAQCGRNAYSYLFPFGLSFCCHSCFWWLAQLPFNHWVGDPHISSQWFSSWLDRICPTTSYHSCIEPQNSSCHTQGQERVVAHFTHLHLTVFTCFPSINMQYKIRDLLNMGSFCKGEGKYTTWYFKDISL